MSLGGSDDPTVLLVDDNAQNLKVLYEILKDRGYRLLIANDGEKALSLAQRNLPEVILLDIMMPGMDGFEVCRRLKSDPITADCAVVFLSALDEVDAKVRGFALGGADYIAKPFQSQEVIARVETHVRVIQLERALQARNRQLESDQSRILNAISEGIYGLDVSGRIIFANPSAAVMNRCEVDALTGQNFFRMHFVEQDQWQDDKALPVLETCRQGISEHRRGVLMRRPDGTRFCAEYQATPKREGEQVLGAVVVFRDITQELENERKLASAQALVQEQREQLAHAARLSTMGEMAAGFAHEVNQPLTAITNYVRVALRLTGNEPIDQALLQETLTKIEAQSHRASEVIRRIRGFVKKPASGKEAVNVAELLEETRRFAEVDARTNDIGIQIKLPDELNDVYADPIQVQQVALNLIRNALEATRACGHDEPVEVTADTDKDKSGFVRIRVRDHGCGLPEDAENRLFLPFFSTKQNGMGIGLAMCRSLVQAQGGDIGFNRLDDGGTEFFFTLPTVDAS